MGTLEPATRHPRRRNLLMIGVHLVWGAATAAAMRELRAAREMKIEQLRDVITEHIPDEERVWLDPLKHSYLDLLEVTALPATGGALAVRSIGDGTAFMLPAGAFAKGGRRVSSC